MMGQENHAEQLLFFEKEHKKYSWHDKLYITLECVLGNY